MKVTVVPAQVTTVEDRIIGNLGFSQVLLLIVPVFVSAGVFALFPPFMGSAAYKYTIMAFLAGVCCLLAIRIRGKILAAWAITILRYNLRPKYYLFNKNTSAHRLDYSDTQVEVATTEVVTDESQTTLQPRLSTIENAKVLAAIENPAAKLRFETSKKGGLYVRLTEVEE